MEQLIAILHFWWFIGLEFNLHGVKFSFDMSKLSIKWWVFVLELVALQKSLSELLLKTGILSLKLDYHVLLLFEIIVQNLELLVLLVELHLQLPQNHSYLFHLLLCFCSYFISFQMRFLKFHVEIMNLRMQLNGFISLICDSPFSLLQKMFHPLYLRSFPGDCDLHFIHFIRHHHVFFFLLGLSLGIYLFRVWVYLYLKSEFWYFLLQLEIFTFLFHDLLLKLKVFGNKLLDSCVGSVGGGHLILDDILFWLKFLFESLKLVLELHFFLLQIKDQFMVEIGQLCHIGFWLFQQKHQLFIPIICVSNWLDTGCWFGVAEFALESWEFLDENFERFALVLIGDWSLGSFYFLGDVFFDEIVVLCEFLGELSLQVLYLLLILFPLFFWLER